MEKTFLEVKEYEPCRWKLSVVSPGAEACLSCIKSVILAATMEFSMKIDPLSDPAIPLLKINWNEVKLAYEKATFNSVFIAAQSTINTWKQLRCLLKEEWTKNTTDTTQPWKRKKFYHLQNMVSTRDHYAITICNKIVPVRDHYAQRNEPVPKV